jgi:hypothetical protein
MKKYYLLAMMCTCAFANQIFAQAAGNYLYNNNYGINTDRAVVNVNSTSANATVLKAEVMMNVKATSFTAIFAATQTGKDVYDVDSLMNLRINQVLYALGMMGIPETDVHLEKILETFN